MSKKGKAIKRALLLLSCGLTQRALAEHLGVSEAMVSRELNDIRQSQKLREDIAKLFGVDVSEIFD